MLAAAINYDGQQLHGERETAPAFSFSPGTGYRTQPISVAGNNSAKLNARTGAVEPLALSTARTGTFVAVTGGDEIAVTGESHYKTAASLVFMAR